MLRLHVAIFSLIPCVLALAGPAAARCRDVIVSAKGVEKQQIEDAQSSASDALVAKIGKLHGKNWGPGSHRNGSFQCNKVLGYRTGWTCTAKTTAICAP